MSYVWDFFGINEFVKSYKSKIVTDFQGYKPYIWKQRLIDVNDTDPTMFGTMFLFQ
jgi:hypothetical protein